MVRQNKGIVSETLTVLCSCFGLGFMTECNRRRVCLVLRKQVDLNERGKNYDNMQNENETLI